MMATSARALARSCRPAWRAATARRLAPLSAASRAPVAPVVGDAPGRLSPAAARWSSSDAGGGGGGGDVQARIADLVKADTVVVFMKGVPDQPRCGFSNAVVQIMRMHGVPFTSHDVLQDEDIRQGIKEFSNWPTIPQVYLDGEFVGGCDILLQMHQNGELVEDLKKVGITSALLTQEEEENKK